jgi:protein-disulfide isomerase
VNLTKLFSILIAIVTLSACSYKDALKKILTDNPDILIEAMEKNPDKFAGVLNKITARSRQAMDRMNQQQEMAQREEEFKNPKQIEIEPGRAVSGDKKAPITIVVFSDFQCPFCKRGFDTVTEVQKKYGKEVRFMFKHYPLPFHPLARPAAEYFEAIALQSPKKAYLFHNEVFTNQQLLATEKEAFLDKAAQKAGADMTRLKADIKSDKVKERIQKDMDEANKLGVRGTPKFFINGVSLTGARPINDFDVIITRWLNKN